MKHRFFWILIILSSASWSCTPDSLSISVEPSEPKIAVASLVGPEDLILVSLTHSFSALSAENVSDITNDFANTLLLNRALVTIHYEGITDTLFPFFDISGLYYTQLSQANDFQRMELSVFDSTTSEAASAQSLLLPAVDIDSVGITRRDTAISYFADFNYRLPDPDINQDNYFVVHVYQFTPPESDSTETDSSNSGLFFDTNNFLIFEQLLTDLGTDEDGYIRRNEVIEFSSSIDSALVVVTNIEEGYYNFLDARNRSGGIAASLANEPVNHPTNVQNGVGYFSAHQPKGQIVIVAKDD